MLNTTTFVGPDVHARSIKAVALTMTGEVRSATFAYDAAAVAEWVGSSTLPQSAFTSPASPVRPAEEATALGVDCVVGVVSKMTAPGRPKRKNDRQRRRVSRQDVFRGKRHRGLGS